MITVDNSKDIIIYTNFTLGRHVIFTTTTKVDPDFGIPKNNLPYVVQYNYPNMGHLRTMYFPSFKKNPVVLLGNNLDLGFELLIKDTKNLRNKRR